MNKKLIIGILLILLCSYYPICKERKAQDWVRENGGSMVLADYWVSKKSPEFMKPIIRKIIGRWVYSVRLIENDKVTDISQFRNFSGVYSLHLRDTKIKDLDPIKNYEDLESLNLYNTQVKDLTKLDRVKSLKHLVLSNTQVSDISPLSRHKDLTFLMLGDLSVNSIEVLRGLNKLQKLAIPSDVTDISVLKKHPNLTTVWLGGSKVESLDALIDLPKLRHIGTRDTKITLEQEVAFKKKRPDVNMGDWRRYSSEEGD